MAARPPARARLPSTGWILTSDDRNRAHLAACRHHTRRRTKVQQECRHNYRLVSNVASIYGQKPSDVGHAAYCVSKFGVIGLTKTAAIDYGQQGIRVNAICPGYAHSEMVDPYLRDEPDLMRAVIDRHSASGRVGESDEIADAIAFLCSHSARFVNGAELVVDGGDRVRAY
jgi:NAD(P)-dependent dehydrogenase (short-subunit alcohol dehydrogenase family)